MTDSGKNALNIADEKGQEDAQAMLDYLNERAEDSRLLMFKLGSTYQNLGEMVVKCEALQGGNRELTRQVDELKKQVEGQKTQVDELRASLSWRATGPLRKAASLLAKGGRKKEGR